jgi:hypothetical protein
MLAFLVGSTYAIVGCSNSSDQTEAEAIEEDVDSSLQEPESDGLSKTKQVFYSLPSPIETALLLKRAGAKFNQDYLNSPDNAGKYTTSKLQALNLGVYGADLSFVSMFDQSQLSIKYLSVVKKLADDLGILNAVDQGIFDRMNANIDNTDSLMEIISETFMNSDSFLKESDRTEVAAIVLVGGWMEGLYIAMQIAKSTDGNKEIIQRIIDQRLSLNTLLNLLDDYKDNPDIQELITTMQEINKLFNKISVTSSKIETVVGEDGKSELKSSIDVKYDPKDLDELFSKVEMFRNATVS